MRGRPRLGGGPRGQFREAGTDRLGVQRLVAVRPEDRREVGGLDAAEHHIGVGDGERAAAPVAGRARVRAGRVGADPVAAAVEVQYGAAAGRDGVDVHHGRAHPYTRDLVAEDPLELAGVVRHIGGGAAHVEADDPVVAAAGLGGRTDHADHAARGPGQHRVLAAEVRGLPQPSVGLHEHQPDTGELGGDLVDIAAQDRGEVGVDDGGVAARHQLHQRADLVRAADLGEAGAPGQLGDRLLVLGVAVAVQQDDGGAAQTVRAGPDQRPRTASTSSGRTSPPRAPIRSGTSITRS